MYIKKQRQNNTDRFMSDMSHLLRTPLGEISCLAQAGLENTEDREKTKDFLHKILNESSFLLTLADDILDLSKIRDGTFELNIKRCNIIKTAKASFRQVENRALKKNITFTYDDSGVMHHHVFADKARLRQVLTNIISNAVKFTPEDGNAVFSVSEQACSKKNCASYVFTCHDSGTWQDKTSSDKLSNTFAPGTSQGIGLALSEEITSIMGGKLTYSDTVTGTEVTAQIPFEICVDEKDGKQDIPNFSGMNVLVVEDNKINMLVTEHIISLTGATIIKASNGLEAVNAVDSSPEGFFDLILTDIQMPIMNGHDAARAIRILNRHDCESLPIYAVTADVFEGACDDCINGFIYKPLDINEVYRIMNRCYRR